MVWGVRGLVPVGACSVTIFWSLHLTVGCGIPIFVLCIGMSIAKLASAAPTAGGVSGVHKLCAYFDSLQGLLLDPYLCFTSLAKPTFLDSRL